jgi:hypothetical protein
VGIYDLPPFSNLQVNRAFTKLQAGFSGNAYATVEVVTGNGRVTAYASVVDNATGDAIFIPGRVPEAASQWVIPVVARRPGAAGTWWLSDVRLYNHAAEQVDLDLQFRPRLDEDGELETATATVPSGCVLALDDVLGSTFGLDRTSGSLRVATSDGAAVPMGITSRTANRTDEGSYGQFIPAVSHGLRHDGTVIHLDKSSDFRSNLGLCEVAGGSVTLLLELLDSSGSVQGNARVVELGPYELAQINDIYSYVGAADQDNTRVEISRMLGDGSWAAYASVVDRHTGDAIYVPARALGQ